MQTKNPPPVVIPQVFIFTQANFRKIEANSNNVVATWSFIVTSFVPGNENLVSKIRGTKLKVLSCTTDTIGDEKQKIKEAFYDLPGFQDLFINTNAHKSLFATVDLYHFVYRTPLSRSLTQVYLVGDNSFDANLAKGLSYASSVKELTVSYTNFTRAPKLAFLYYQSRTLEVITMRELPLADWKGFFRSGRRHCLQEVNFDSSFNERITKVVLGSLMKHPKLCSVSVMRGADPNSVLSKYCPVLCRHCGISYIAN